MLFEPILAADFIELLTRGIPVILFILWLIGQAMSERQKQGKVAPRQERPEQRPAPAPAPQEARQNPRQKPNEIEDEIEAFLRRASDKRQQARPKRERDETVILVPPQQEAGRTQPVAVPRESRRSERPAARRAAAAGGLSRAAMEGAVPATPGPQSPAPKPLVLQSGRPLRSGSLGSLRSSLESTSATSAGAASDLADELSGVDERMGTHMHSVFDHQVGRLHHRETTPTRRVSGSPLAESVVKMLRDPQGVQQLIVANEILRRPEL